MKKIILSLLVLVASQILPAVECSSEAEVIISQISSSKSCYEASQIAQECAWGSSIDVQFVGAASEICLANYDSWSDKHKIILSTLSEDCNKKYENEQGSLYRSMNAFCYLGVVEVLSSLNDEVI